MSRKASQLSRCSLPVQCSYVLPKSPHSFLFTCLFTPTSCRYSCDTQKHWTGPSRRMIPLCSRTFCVYTLPSQTRQPLISLLPSPPDDEHTFECAALPRAIYASLIHRQLLQVRLPCSRQYSLLNCCCSQIHLNIHFIARSSFVDVSFAYLRPISFMSSGRLRFC
jgi:hypothetical protein